MKRLTPFLLVVLSAGQGLAQERDAVESVWYVFNKHCIELSRDPQSFLEGFNAPGPSGERVFSQTPDNRLVTVHTVLNGVVLDAALSATSKGFSGECTVMFYTTDTELNDRSLVSAFKSKADGVEVVGGLAPREQVGLYREGAQIFPHDVHIFALDGLWKDFNGAISAHADTSSFGMSAQFYKAAQ